MNSLNEGGENIPYVIHQRQISRKGAVISHITLKVRVRQLLLPKWEGNQVINRTENKRNKGCTQNTREREQRYWYCEKNKGNWLNLRRVIRRITPPPLKNLYFCLQVRDIIVDVEKALISTGEALKNLLLSKNYATQWCPSLPAQFHGQNLKQLFDVAEVHFSILHTTWEFNQYLSLLLVGLGSHGFSWLFWNPPSNIRFYLLLFFLFFFELALPLVLLIWHT